MQLRASLGLPVAGSPLAALDAKFGPVTERLFAMARTEEQLALDALAAALLTR